MQAIRMLSKYGELKSTLDFYFPIQWIFSLQSRSAPELKRKNLKINTLSYTCILVLNWSSFILLLHGHNIHVIWSECLHGE